MKDPTEFRQRFDTYKKEGIKAVYDCGKTLPKYDDGKTPGPEEDIVPKTTYDEYGYATTTFSSFDDWADWNDAEKWWNKDPYGSFTLPEVVVKPTSADKRLLHNIQLMIPDKKLRNHVYMDIENKLGYNLAISENEALDRLHMIYNWSGKPFIFS